MWFVTLERFLKFSSSPLTHNTNGTFKILYFLPNICWLDIFRVGTINYSNKITRVSFWLICCVFDTDWTFLSLSNMLPLPFIMSPSLKIIHHPFSLSSVPGSVYTGVHCRCQALYDLHDVTDLDLWLWYDSDSSRIVDGTWTFRHSIETIPFFPVKAKQHPWPWLWQAWQEQHGMGPTGPLEVGGDDGDEYPLLTTPLPLPAVQ